MGPGLAAAHLRPWRGLWGSHIVPAGPLLGSWAPRAVETFHTTWPGQALRTPPTLCRLLPASLPGRGPPSLPQGGPTHRKPLAGVDL